MNIYYNLKYGIRNLIKWFPIVWKDRDWDHYFIFKMLEFKLKNMEKMFRNHAHFVGSEKVADDIHKCALVLDRILKDEYHESVFKRHYEKWGEIKHWFEDADSGEYKQFRIENKNVKTEEDREKCNKEFLELCKVEEKMRDQDIKYVFKVMSKKILGWWD